MQGWSNKESFEGETDDKVEFQGNVKGSNFALKLYQTHRSKIFRYISYRVQGLNIAIAENNSLDHTSPFPHTNPCLQDIDQVTTMLPSSKMLLSCLMLLPYIKAEQAEKVKEYDLCEGAEPNVDKNATISDVGLFMTGFHATWNSRPVSIGAPCVRRQTIDS
jgi:hypothetical protein